MPGCVILPGIMDTGNITSLNQANRQIAILQDRNVDLLNQNALLADRNHALEQKTQDLQRQLDWFKRQLFGQKSEKILPGPDEVPSLPGFEGSPKETPQAKGTESDSPRTSSAWFRSAADSSFAESTPSVRLSAHPNLPKNL